MKTSINKDIVLGLYITIGLLLFIGAIYFIGSQQGMFGSTIRIHAVFNDVSGLKAGNNVRMSGIKIGTVENIRIISDSSVTVSLLIDKNASQFVKKDAYAVIESNGLMGNKVVSISPGSTQSVHIENNDKIQSKNPADFDEAISSFNEMTDNANRLITNLVQISDNINNAEGLLGEVVSDSLLARRVEKLMLVIEKTANNTEAITQQMQYAMGKINHGDGLAARAINDESWANNVDDILDSARFATENLAQTSRALDEFVNKLNSSQGTVDKIISDTTMAGDLKSAIHNIDEGTQNLDQVMNTVQNSWILNLFHKNKKKDKDKHSESDSTGQTSEVYAKPER